MLISPERQDEYELKKILITLISLYIGSFHHNKLDGSSSLFLFVYEGLKREGFRGYATSVRDAIYKEMSSHPRSQESSNKQLSHDTHELQQELEGPEGFLSSILSFHHEPCGRYEEQDVLQEFNRVEEFDIADLSTDPGIKLTAAAGIACARSSRTLGPTERYTFVEWCGLICDRFKRFPGDQPMPPTLPPAQYASPITILPPAKTVVNHQALQPPTSVSISQHRHMRGVLERKHDQIVNHAITQFCDYRSSHELLEFQRITDDLRSQQSMLYGQFDQIVKQFLGQPLAPPCTPAELPIPNVTTIRPKDYNTNSEASESDQELMLNPDIRRKKKATANPSHDHKDGGDFDSQSGNEPNGDFELANDD